MRLRRARLSAMSGRVRTAATVGASRPAQARGYSLDGADSAGGYPADTERPLARTIAEVSVGCGHEPASIASRPDGISIKGREEAAGVGGVPDGRRRPDNGS
jgi:hypothetical protein